MLLFLFSLFLVATKDLCYNSVCIKCSVTAEKWLPILEVPVSSVKAFLDKKRHEGYSLIGLEQTANSTPLDRFSFPNKTVRAKSTYGKSCFSIFFFAIKT